LARRRITLPVLVSRNRFAAPLCVFIFGMVAVVSVPVPAAPYLLHWRQLLHLRRGAFAVALYSGALLSRWPRRAAVTTPALAPGLIAAG
jgi:hypothetical protein